MKFAPGDLVRNVKTIEDGKVIEAYAERGATMYMVSFPLIQAVGAWGPRLRTGQGDLDSSNNDSLSEDLFV